VSSLCFIVVHVVMFHYLGHSKNLYLLTYLLYISQTSVLKGLGVVVIATNLLQSVSEKFYKIGQRLLLQLWAVLL